MKQPRNPLLVSFFFLTLVLFDLIAALTFEDEENVENYLFLRRQELNTRVLKGQKKEKKRKKLILIVCLAVGSSILFCGILVVAVWYYHRHYVGGGLTHIAVAVADAINRDSASTQQSTNYHCQENNGTIAYVRAIPLASYHQRQNGTMSGSSSNNGVGLPSSHKCVSTGQQVGGQSAVISSSKTKHYVTRRPPR